MFWKSDARYQPGKLVGAFILFYGLFRFAIEFVREPDAQFAGTMFESGLHMGQWLSLPMIVGGLYLILTAKKRRVRVEPIAGSESVA
jgi:phosphatidylglycerol:prolipoprotein diacylglycerol transferase